MSRLIVKNLPKNITEDKLKQLFSEKGVVTDIQLKYTSDGKFRQFAFVGYQNETQANEAIEYFDKMCINTQRLNVSHCVGLGDASKPKAWSKYAPEHKAVKKVNQKEEKDVEIKEGTNKKNKKKATNLLEKYKADPLFKEFMQVHAPKETHLLEETNDKESDKEEENTEEPEADEGEEEKEKNKLAFQNISDAEYVKGLLKENDSKSSIIEKIAKKDKPLKEKIQLFTVKLRGLPYSCKKKDIKQFFSPVVPYTIRLPPKIKGIAYVGFKNEKQMKKALIKDKSFINGKRIFVLEYKGQQQNSEEKIDHKKNKWKNQEEQVKNEESIAESGRIFLRNLSYTVTENDIRQLFEKYGLLTEVNIPIDPVSRQMKGFGTVTFLMPEHAVKAYAELDGSILHGRMLHLLPGKAKDTVDSQIEESSNYKQKKLAHQKSTAGSSHNWNSLFLGHDAVAGVIADSFGVSKETVLAPHGEGSAAVRLALGETQIVATTRKYLEQEGVILDAFSTPGSKRSKTVILVKNLPSKTEPREVKELFEKFGVLGRVILPPSGITAIVEFMEPSEARKAFLRLSYSKFKNMPMYLEWAPENSLTESAPVQKAEEIKDTKTDELKTEETNDKQAEEDDEEEPEENTTIFVKNLNFETTDDSLRKHFENCGKIHYAKVALKRDKNNPNNKLSMGFGFVQFMHKASADRALKTLQQSSLDGKSLELKRSERTLKDEVKAARKASKSTKQTGTKILVRNVPFQASKKEIGELFRTFGDIKALRMPKKVNPGSDQHRGFAFVDFATESDAKAAFEALCQSTHLYGRRLVLEWAAVMEDVSQIRKRTADHFQPTEKPKSSKKSVFDIS